MSKPVTVSRLTASTITGTICLILGGIIGASTVHDLPINTDPTIRDPRTVQKPPPIPIAPPVKKGLDLHWTGDWYYLKNWPMGHVIRAGTFDYMSGQDVPPFLFIGVCGDEQTGLVTEGEARKFVEAGTKGNLQDGGIVP